MALNTAKNLWWNSSAWKPILVSAGADENGGEEY